MADLGVFLAVIALVVCFLDWRTGILLTIALGFIADPVRKLIPGQPVILTVAVAGFALVSLFGLLQERNRPPLRELIHRYGAIARPLQWFLPWLVFAALLTILNFGSPVLAGIGLLAYLAPLPSVLLAHHYSDSPPRMKRLLTTYLVICVAMELGVILARFGPAWPVLQRIGPEKYVAQIGVAFSGFFRAPEVAAWHAATAVCLLLILATASQRPLSRPLTAGLIVMLLVVGLLTGRRKMLAQIVLFVGLYGVSLVYLRRGGEKLLAIGLLVASLAGFAISYPLSQLDAAQGPRFEAYFSRGVSVFASAPERLEHLGLGSLRWAMQSSGILGRGAGVASQGSQHFGGGADLVGGSGEGGLGKIVLELGIPGLLLFFWLGLAVAGTLWRTIRHLARVAPDTAPLAAGLAALLVAQVPTFVVASQIYGDPFVLTMVGVFFGLVLAVGSWPDQHHGRYQF